MRETKRVTQGEERGRERRGAILPSCSARLSINRADSLTSQGATQSARRLEGRARERERERCNLSPLRISRCKYSPHTDEHLSPSPSPPPSTGRHATSNRCKRVRRQRVLPRPPPPAGEALTGRAAGLAEYHRLQIVDASSLSLSLSLSSHDRASRRALRRAGERPSDRTWRCQVVGRVVAEPSRPRSRSRSRPGSRTITRRATMRI